MDDMATIICGTGLSQLLNQYKYVYIPILYCINLHKINIPDISAQMSSY